MSELKPCPFCGGEAGLSGWQSSRKNLSVIRACCQNCKAFSAAFDTAEKAIEAWNRRVKEEKGNENGK